MITIEHSNFPWLVTIPTAENCRIGKPGRANWRRAIRHFLRDQGAEYYWEEMNAESILLRVATEDIAVLLKLRFEGQSV